MGKTVFTNASQCQLRFPNLPNNAVVELGSKIEI
jgi:hypothetical protein